ncbi:hypothetical protein RSA46_19335 [Pseudomonas oryzihabitans]|nr:hypothetical protein RSA46_19335 [Pseudomonas psychrotolerans]
METIQATNSDVRARQIGRWYVLFLMTLVYTFNVADRYVGSTLVEPIKKEFGLSDGQVGMLTGAAVGLLYIGAGIPLGLLADRTNRKRMIAIALAFWSALTAVCGLANTFTQLMLARMGVGIGEAGGIPAAQSILSDTFEPKARAVAITIFSLGAAIGTCLGASLGGYIAEVYGWRMVLITFGLAGLPVALLVWCSIREPMRGQFDATGSSVTQSTPGLFDGLHYIVSQKALVHVLAGSAVLTFWGWGTAWWLPSYLARSHGMGLQQSGEMLGTMYGLGGVVVTLGTAWFMRMLADKQASSQTNFVAIATAVATIPSILIFYTQDINVVTVCMWLFVPLIYVYIGPSFALVQNLSPFNMRGQMCAWFLLIVNVVNFIAAPLFLGTASDLISSHINSPTESLRWVLFANAFSGFWAAWHYHMAGKYMATGLRHAGSSR